jgi:putative heme-binding domain-containing protein
MRRSSLLPVLLIAALVFAPCARAEWLPVRIPTAAGSVQDTAEPQWYRCHLRVPDNMVTPAEKDLWRDSVILHLGGIRGPFSVLLNGRTIAEGQSLPEQGRRRFKVPKDILQKGVFNVLAIRAPGGIAQAPILAGYFDELLLEGEWEFWRGELPADAHAPAKQPPGKAVFTEAQFHPAGTPLDPTIEPIPGARLAPAESLAKMKPAHDLAVELVLHEPEVAQPTHISFDERGRMWVAQYRQYPYPAGLRMVSRDKYYRSHFDRTPPAPPHHDRGRDCISVHEDTDGDGTFDETTVVLDGLNMANAALRGHGGIWVMHTPYLVFYPDANGDDVPDRDPEVRLAGFGLEDTHSVANGLAWGPDGWLYGAQGSTTTSRVVRPGIDPPGSPGIYHEGCMVWRYHPQRRIYEIFAIGGGNVFGLDFDGEGRLFSGHNGGETRGWHYVPGGILLKQGIDPGKFGATGHPFAFGFLPHMKSRNPVPRFSHATILAEGTALPEHYRGRFFAADPLHRNVVVAERYPVGSTFETSDSGVAVVGDDPAFRPVYLTNAPDGAIYAADFYEEFIAHGQNYQGQIDPSTGRIYRLRGKGLPLDTDVNLASKTTGQLVALLSHPNRWHRHTAVRLLGERRDAATVEPLRALLSGTETHPALEALWALHQMDQIDENSAARAMAHPAAPVRMWMVRLAGESEQLFKWVSGKMQELCRTEQNAEVRSQLAATARRLPAGQALRLVELLASSEIVSDADDAYIPLLCWWALESHCDTARDSVIALFQNARLWESSTAKTHLLPRLMRRFASSGAHADFIACAQLLELAPNAESRQSLLAGFEGAFAGRAVPALPDELIAALDKAGRLSPHLRVRLGDPAAIASALATAADSKAKAEDRLLTVRLLGQVHTPGAVPVLLRTALENGNAELRKAALASLLLYDEPSIGSAIAARFSALPQELRASALNLLASRPTWSGALPGLLEAGALRPAEIPPDIAARLRTQSDPGLAARMTALLSEKPAAPDATSHAEVQRIRAVLTGGPGDPYRGEPIFLARCASCHVLFHKGGRIGPDLTAYQRDDLSTLLPSVVDPNAEIREGFETHLVTTTDGRSLSGFIADKSAAVLVLRSLDGQDISLPHATVRDQQRLPQSLMPAGLLTGLNEQELRDFFAYLRISQPITR